MPVFTLNKIHQAVGGTNDISTFEDIEITSVSFDSRKIEPGALFVPLIAENDGHDYINSAIKTGAVAAFWSHDLNEAPSDIPVIEVSDTLQALKDFAKNYLVEVNPKVVGITGSNGKTTTKDMTAAVAQAKYKTHKTQGNFNNTIGMPITILTMPRDTEVLILEMGMNHAGEIHDLSTLAEPDIVAITIIGESHIEYFGTRAGIADAKMEIVDGLKPDGSLIYFGDEPLLRERVADRPGLVAKTFGEETTNDMYPVFVEESMRETTFATNQNAKEATTIPIPGKHNVNNAMAAILIGEMLGVDLNQADEALKAFDMTKNRMEWVEGEKNLFILNDAYNASPTSMKASVNYFSQLEVPNEKWVILGEMGELGSKSDAMHLSVKETLDPDAFAHVVLYGDGMKPLYDALVEEGNFKEGCISFFTGDKAPMIDYLKSETKPREYLLFKSSLSTDLLSVVSALEKQ